MATEAEASETSPAPGSIVPYAGHNTPSAEQIAREIQKMQQKQTRMPGELLAILGVIGATVVGVLLGRGKGGGSVLMIPFVLAFTACFVWLRLQTRRQTPAIWRNLMFLASVLAIIFTPMFVAEAKGDSWIAIRTHRPAPIGAQLVGLSVAIFALAEVAAVIQRRRLRKAAPPDTTAALPEGNTLP